MASPTPSSHQQEENFYARRESGWSSCDLDGIESDIGSDYLPRDAMKMSMDFGCENCESPLNENNDACGFFIPEGKFDVNKLPKKEMYNLPQESLPIGKKVWVTDECDVKMELGDAWNDNLKKVCNGHAVGSVVRHQERLSLVLFVDPIDGLKFCFTLPRRCLSVDAFDPYNNSTDDETEMTIFVGALGPSCVYEKEKRNDVVCCVAQQFFDVVEPIVPSQTTEAAWALFSKMNFVAAVESLSDIISNIDTRNTKLLLECLIMRSFAYFFNGNIDDSLQDSLRIINTSLSCTQGYVRVARVYAYLGKIQLGIEMMNQAMLLLPHSHEINITIQLLSKIRQLQKSIDEYFLTYYIDANYARRLMARRGFCEGDTIIDEEVLIGAPSIENEGVCCDFCIGPAAKCLPVPGMSEYKDANTYFDSFRCQSCSQSYLPLERGRAERSFNFAYTMMQSKASSTADILSIERARLTVRLFYTIFSKNSIPEINNATPEVIMNGMGLYPIPSCSINNKMKEDLEALYNIVTNFMSEKERVMYTKELFIQVYSYVVEYALHIEDVTERWSDAHLPATASSSYGSVSSSVGGNEKKNMSMSKYARYSGYVISTVASCVSRSESNDAVNCRVVSVTPGKVSLVAIREIQMGHQLVISALRKERINDGGES